MRIILVRSWSWKVCYWKRVTDVMNFRGRFDRYVERETTKYFAHIHKQRCMENNFSFVCFTWFWTPAIKVYCLLSIDWLTWACMLHVPAELWAWTPLWTLPTPLTNMTVGSPQERSHAISICRSQRLTFSGFKSELRCKSLSSKVKLIFLFKWSHRSTQWH